MDGIIFYILFGLIAGSIANYLDPHPSQGGVLGSIVLGIIGAVIGGYLGNNLFGVGVTGFNFSSFAVAIIGSLLAIWGSRTLTRGRLS